MKSEVSYCNLPGRITKKATNKTMFYRHKGDYTWQGIRTERYKDDGSHWADVVRRVLIGNRNESTKFHLRYFEILPGGHSSLEKHKHEHVVIGLRGKGRVFCGKKSYALNFLDTIYIAPNTPHQLRNPFEEPFGFLCIVNARRDKPKILKKSSRQPRIQGFREKGYKLRKRIKDSESSNLSTKKL